PVLDTPIVFGDMDETEGLANSHTYNCIEFDREQYEIISPDQFLRPYLKDYEELAQIHQVVRANYERGVPVDKAFLRKTARLVQEHTQTGEIHEPDEIHKLTAEALEKIAYGDKPDTVKVCNLLKTLD